MFIDKAKIYVKGGDGGAGAASFRREKYVALDGPDGGDGGNGGHVIFLVDQGMNTLQDFRYKRHFRAKRGVHGQGSQKHGKRGEDLYVKVPAGTVVIDEETGEVIADLVHDGQEIVVAKGGRGGRGNARFKTSTNRAPKRAENGEPGQERTLIIELKLLADVGLVGFPNAGKSTLLSRVSAARPKIADYPFTTLEPNLGVVEVRMGETFVLADIPGLIEGAHTGAGLGLEFLRHLERTRVLLHIIDVSGGTEGRDPVQDFQVVNNELKSYVVDLSNRPQIVVANKMDVVSDSDNLDRLKEEADRFNMELIAISAVTGEGTSELLEKTYHLLQISQEQIEIQSEEVIFAPPEPDKISVSRDEAGVFVVHGKQMERLFTATDFSNYEALEYFGRKLRQLGINRMLEEAGAQEGDLVRIGKYPRTFEFAPEE